jgi:hypothetical protein
VTPELPDGINTNVAHSARVYHYWLGGKDNFPADSRAAYYWAGIGRKP